MKISEEKLHNLPVGQEPCRLSLSLGQLVRSKQGRDQGEFYLVYAIDGDCVLVVDGRKRSVDHPKKKNRRHLQHVGRVAADFADKLVDGQPVTNEDIREAISNLVNRPGKAD